MILRKKKLCTILFLALIFFPLTTTNFFYYFKPNSNPQVKDYSEEIKVKTSAGSWITSITRAVGTNPSWLDAGDANNDGYPDIVVSHSNHDKISILTWNSSINDWNTYIQRDTGGFPGKPVIARVNGDAYNDIIVPNYDDEEVSIYFGRSDHTWDAEFTKYVGPHPFSVAVGDANNDGYNDLAISHYAHNYISVYTWNGAGGWNYAEILQTEWNPAHIVIADVDNDGDNDILASHNNGSGGLSVLLWNGADWDDYFYINVPDYPSTIAVADVDDDGDKDIVCALVGLYSPNNKVAIMLWNSSTKTWETTIKTVGYGPRVFIGDANTDGKNDIVCANSADDTVSILLWNSGTSDWKSQIVLPLGNGPSNPIIKDFNHDGKNDIAAANWDDHNVSLLYWFEDNTPPSITINNPIQNGNYSAAPTFNVDISDNYYIHKKWYTLNANPTKHFFTNNEPISGWASVPDGTVALNFYANDTVGNEISESVFVNKDSIAPFLYILSPTAEEYFGDIAPNYIIEVFDEYLDTIWYTLNGGGTNYTITDLTGTFNQTAWGALSEGRVTIRFYANDTIGNVDFSTIEVLKIVHTEGFPFILIITISAVSLGAIIGLVSIYRLKKRKIDPN